MLNKEYYAKEMINIATSDDNGVIAVDIYTKKLCKCSNKACDDCLFNGNCRTLRNKWANSEYVETIGLTLTEKIVLENLDSNYKWVARDNDGKLNCYEKKPIKSKEFWYRNSGDIIYLPLSNLFKFIKQEDDEPYKIEDILNICEVVEDGNLG